MADANLILILFYRSNNSRGKDLTVYIK